MKIKIMCEEKWLNKHSDGGRYGYNNPFTKYIPMVGDVIEIGGIWFGQNDDRNCEGERYVVKERLFRTYERLNNSYCKQELIINVSKI